jgi:hypothetical protein
MRALAVKFQEVVVHSVENWEADVVEAKAISGGRMDNYHHHARLLIRGREELAKKVLDRGADRADDRAEPGHGQSHPGSLEAEQDTHARTEAARHPL